MKVAVVIPALKPSVELISYVEQLLLKKSCEIFIVNDGSDQTYDHIFNTLELNDACTVLKHDVNKGKGAALKTAIHYIFTKRKDILGIVTADADGQHHVDDVIRVSDMLEKHPNDLILGVREFNKETPLKSRVGNGVSSLTMNLVYNIRLSDTQTGLRAIGHQHFCWLTSIEGDRYEYELRMLIQSKIENITIKTIIIQTLYFDNNAGSHFNAIKDSYKIYSIMLSGLFSYMSNSIVSAIVDVALFSLLIVLLTALHANEGALIISGAAILSRICSSLVNYSMNKKLFNDTSKNIKTSFKRYYLLWITQLTLSIVAVILLESHWQYSVVSLKVIIDLLLALFSYQIQLRYVFEQVKCQTNEQGLLFKSLKVIGRLFLKKTIKQSPYFMHPALLIGHHQNLYGPIALALNLPNRTRLWVLDVFFDRKSCFEQYYHFTFTKRWKLPKSIAYLCAAIASYIVPKILNSARAIPVARHSRKITETVKASLLILEDNMQIVIFPDLNYESDAQEMGQIYTGFLTIAKYYYKRMNKQLPIIPVSCHKFEAEIELGTPLFFKSTVFSKEERAQMGDKIIQSMNNMSK